MIVGGNISVCKIQAYTRVVAAKDEVGPREKEKVVKCTFEWPPKSSIAGKGKRKHLSGRERGNA